MALCGYTVTRTSSDSPIEYLEEVKLVNCSGTIVDASKVFKNKKIIAYYFSASWCNPCRTLLPKIKEIYEENKHRRSGLEIIYISADEEKETMMSYFKERHGGWFAIPFGDTSAEVLRRVYDVTHIPRIIVVKIDGTVISTQGVQDVNNMGMNVLVAWNAESI